MRSFQSLNVPHVDGVSRHVRRFALNNEVNLIEEAIDELLLSAKTTGPHARHKLRGLLRYYAKKSHPFTACVNDNLKRFGPGKTQAYCATLKDIIRGTTKWRGHPNLDHGSPGAVAASEEEYFIDNELALILSEISDEQINRASKILEGGI